MHSLSPQLKKRKLNSQQEFNLCPLNEDQRSIVLANIPLAKKVARLKWEAHPSYCLDDMVQSAYLGLISATRRFDPSKGFTFASYAWMQIEGYVTHYIRDRVPTIKTPHDKEPIKVWSFDCSVGRDGDSRDLFIDTLPDLQGVIQSEQTEKQKLITSLVEELPEKLKVVIGLRYFSGLTAKETAKRLGLSQNAVCSRSKKAYQILREKLVGLEN